MKKEEKFNTSLRKYSQKVNYLGTICKGGKSSLKIFMQNMDAEFYEMRFISEKKLGATIW